MKRLKLFLILQLITLHSFSQEWVNVGDGVGGKVYDLLSFEDNLYASGRLGPSSRGVYYWDGQDWNNTNSIWGIFSPITMEVYAGQLYASGDFNGSNGSPTKVLKWENEEWKQQGEQFILGDWNSVKKLKVYGDYLYAGGQFEYVGTDQQAKNIAKWDGENWQNVGDGIPSLIIEMDVFQNQLVVCHQIQESIQINDSTWNNIFRRKLQLWDNNEWEDLDSLFDNKSVSLIRVIDEKLYFRSKDTINNIPIINLAYWDGNSITSIGDTLFHDISDVREINGELFVACRMKTSNPNLSINVIRKLENDDWITVGGVFNDNILPLHIHESELYVGGWFNQADNQIVNSIVKYSTTTSSLFDLGKTHDFEVYPNPLKLEVNLFLKNALMSKLYLFSTEGDLIQEWSNINANRTALDLSFLSNGIYFIKLIDSENREYIQKIEKN